MCYTAMLIHMERYTVTPTRLYTGNYVGNVYGTGYTLLQNTCTYTVPVMFYDVLCNMVLTWCVLNKTQLSLYVRLQIYGM